MCVGERDTDKIILFMFRLGQREREREELFITPPPLDATERKRVSFSLVLSDLFVSRLSTVRLWPRRSSRRSPTSSRRWRRRARRWRRRTLSSPPTWSWCPPRRPVSSQRRPSPIIYNRWDFFYYRFAVYKIDGTRNFFFIITFILINITRHVKKNI